MKCGLLPICHEAIILGETSLFEYEGQIDSEELRDKLVRALGPNNKVG